MAVNTLRNVSTAVLTLPEKNYPDFLISLSKIAKIRGGGVRCWFTKHGDNSLNLSKTIVNFDSTKICVYECFSTIRKSTQTSPKFCETCSIDSVYFKTFQFGDFDLNKKIRFKFNKPGTAQIGAISKAQK